MSNKIVPNSYFEQVAQKLKNGSAIRLSVMGDSMYPTIHGGKDQILLIPYTGGELPLWCAVFYKSGGTYMIHRLVKRDGNMCEMLGDGNLCKREIVPVSEIIGVLKSVYRPNGKEIDCCGESWLRWGHFWYGILPLRRYILYILKKLRKRGIVQ